MNYLVLLCAVLLVLAVPAAGAENDLRLDWKANRLSLLSPRLPGGKVEVLYLEAFCRKGSTHRKWEETVIPHTTVRLDGEGPTKHLRLRSTLENGVVAEHDLRVEENGVRQELRVTNPGDKAAEVEWLQPCIQVAGFTGRTQETYVERCFIFTGKKEQHGLTRLTELPRNEEAIYKGGQVYVPAGIHREDVNPRPLSDTVPTNGLIGCFSGDDKQILATAWDQTQELFQGVITCIHSDPRIGGLRPHETKTLHGKIYLMDNDVEKLLRLYKHDFPEKRKK